MPVQDAIKHVVLLMMENHSFDEMLGCFQEKYPDLDGIDKNQPPRFNTDKDGSRYYQRPKQTYCMSLDPKHEHVNVTQQLEDANGGFIKDFVASYPSSTQKDRNDLMGYYPRGFLPALHALAEEFTICDKWYSCLPGPTWPNRFFALSGTSSGYTEMPDGIEHPHLDTITAQTQQTIFDRLNEKQKSWKIYYYDFPCSLIFRNLRQPHNLANYRSIEDFFKTDSRLPESQFPDFVFIEPKYFGNDQNDDHPPHNIMKAEKLIADVYNAIRSNESLWNSTLLVIAFDEHGGFYDHDIPPATVPPDDKDTEYDFRQQGVRVPALLVSPWTSATVCHTRFDHTSILKYLIDKWDLGPLGERTAQAVSIGSAINATIRQDATGFIRVPFGQLIKDDSGSTRQTASGHHNALHILADYLDNEMKGVESPLMEKAIIAASGTSGIFEKLKALGVNTLATLGEWLQRLGNILASAGTKAQEGRISRSQHIVETLIGQAAK